MHMMTRVRPPALQGPATLVELLRHRARTSPDRQAYRWIPEGDGSPTGVTDALLDERARAIAATLQGLGLSGQRVLLLYPPGLEYIAAYFGCLYAGVTAVPAYPPRPNKTSPRLSAIVKDVQATAALTVASIHQKMQPRLPEQPDLAALRWIETDSDGALAPASAWVPPSITPQTVAFLQYTSGTTGEPRGVRVTHANLFANAQLIADGFDIHRGDHSVFWLPIYHDMGLIGGVLEPLWLGATTTLMPPAAFLQSPYRWLRAISELKATVSGGPDMAYELCARQVTAEQKATLDLSCWELAFTGAEPIRPQTLQRFTDAFASCGFRRESFYATWGGAEMTLMVTGTRRAEGIRLRTFERAGLWEGRAREVPAGSDGAVTLASLGRTLGTQVLTVVDPQTHVELADGSVGELWLQGPCVADGYHNRPEETAHNFGARVQGRDGTWLRTEDLGFRVDGEAYYVSRMKDVLQLPQGVRYPQEVEQVVESVDPVFRAGFGAAFVRDGALVVVFEQERHRKVDFAELGPRVAEALKTRLGVTLSALVMLRTLGIPKTSSGKIQRRATQAAWAGGTLPVLLEWRSDGTVHHPSRAPAAAAED